MIISLSISGFLTKNAVQYNYRNNFLFAERWRNVFFLAISEDLFRNGFQRNEKKIRKKSGKMK